jgi:hypothetical protein
MMVTAPLAVSIQTHWAPLARWGLFFGPRSIAGVLGGPALYPHEAAMKSLLLRGLRLESAKITPIDRGKRAQSARAAPSCLAPIAT